MLKKVNKKKNKRGISEIVAYAIMIAIAIGLATAVFAWYKVVVEGTKEAVDCKDGTSVYLDSYRCVPSPGQTDLVLTIKNNGGFNVSGVIVKVSDDVAKEPTNTLLPVGGLSINAGTYTFSSDLKPGEQKDATFKNSSSGPIRRVSIQPYVYINKRIVVCQGTLIKEPIIRC